MALVDAYFTLARARSKVETRLQGHGLNVEIVVKLYGGRKEEEKLSLVNYCNDSLVGKLVLTEARLSNEFRPYPDLQHHLITISKLNGMVGEKL